MKDGYADPAFWFSVFVAVIIAMIGVLIVFGIVAPVLLALGRAFWRLVL